MPNQAPLLPGLNPGMAPGGAAPTNPLAGLLQQGSPNPLQGMMSPTPMQPNISSLLMGAMTPPDSPEEDIKSQIKKLTEEAQLKDAISKYFQGDVINQTEDRAVLHTALRGKADTAINVDGNNVMPVIEEVKSAMAIFTNEILNGEVGRGRDE